MRVKYMRTQIVAAADSRHIHGSSLVAALTSPGARYSTTPLIARPSIAMEITTKAKWYHMTTDSKRVTAIWSTRMPIASREIPTSRLRPMVSSPVPVGVPLLMRGPYRPFEGRQNVMTSSGCLCGHRLGGADLDYPVLPQCLPATRGAPG